MKYSYKVTGYINISDDYGMKGTLLDSVHINVLAKDEKEAISKAKMIVKKPLYRISEAREINSDLLIEIELRQKQQELNEQVADNNEQVLKNNIAIKNNIAALAKAIDKLANKIK